MDLWKVNETRIHTQDDASCEKSHIAQIKNAKTKGADCRVKTHRIPYLHMPTELTAKLR